MTTSRQSEWTAAADSKVSSVLIIQPFSFPPSGWLGSSFVLGEFNFKANIEFTLPTRIAVPPRTSYILCIRYVSPITEKLQRFKLFDHQLVDCHYPIYEGQVIAKDFAVEIWCLKNITAINTESWQIETGILNLVLECCGCNLGGEQIAPTLDILLFSTLMPYGQSNPLIGEPPMTNMLVFDQPFHTPPTAS